MLGNKGSDRKRGGTRGGQGLFKWDDVKNDKSGRTYYLGHSVMAATGRWQDNRDISWYTKGSEGGAADLEKERAEARRRDAMLMGEVLGEDVSMLEPSSSSSANTGLYGPGVKREDDKEECRRTKREEKKEKKEKKEAKKEKKEAKKEKKEAKKERKRDRRDQSPSPSHSQGGGDGHDGRHTRDRSRSRDRSDRGRDRDGRGDRDGRSRSRDDERDRRR